MNITLNCDNINICPTFPENFDSLLEFEMFLSKDCCADIKYTKYYRNLQGVKIETVWETLDYQPGMNQCEGYFGLIRRRRLFVNGYTIPTSALLAQVATMTSTAVYKNGSTIISTDMNSYLPNCLTVLTPDPNTVSEQIYEEPGWDSIEITTVITFLSGQVMTHFYKILPIGQNCTFEGTQLGVNYLIQNETYTYTNPPQNMFDVVNNCIFIEKQLVSGYYTYIIKLDSVETKNCQLLDCEGTLPCSISKAITDLISTSCYECNKENNIEQAFQIKLLYEIITSEIDCDDCCSKCLAYEKLTNLLTNCTSC